MVATDGLGCLYRFKVAGGWYLLKFLPPFDGTVSLRDTQDKTRVLASLEEAVRFLGSRHTPKSALASSAGPVTPAQVQALAIALKTAGLKATDEGRLEGLVNGWTARAAEEDRGEG